MSDELWGCLSGDKGYISGLLERDLADKGVIIITGVIKNMKPKVMKLWDSLMLRKPFIIEIVFDKLKNISQIKHSRHRSCISFMAGLSAYSFQPKEAEYQNDSSLISKRLCRSEVTYKARYLGIRQRLYP